MRDKTVERSSVEDTSHRVSSWVCVVAAVVPLVLAAVAEPERSSLRMMRDITSGLAAGSDASWSIPLAPFLSQLAFFVPLGALPVRAAAALSIPAAIGSALIVRRLGTYTFSGRGIAGAAPAYVLSLAIALGAGVFLACVDPAVSIAMIAIELLLASLGKHRSDLPYARPLGVALAALSVLSAPRLTLVLVFAVAMVVERDGQRKSSRLIDMWLPTGAVGLAVMLPFIAHLFVRRERGWVVLLNEQGAAFSAATGKWLSPGASTRAAFGIVVLGTLLLFVSVLTHHLEDDDRRAGSVAMAAAIVAWLCSAPQAWALAVLTLAPLAAVASSSLQIAFDRTAFTWRSPLGRQLLRWLVPALALGTASRAVEDALVHRSPALEVRIAERSIPTLLHASLPPTAVVVVDRASLALEFAFARVAWGAPATIEAVPAGSLLAHAPSEVIDRVMGRLPQSTPLLRAILSRGTVDEADVWQLRRSNPVFIAADPEPFAPLASHAIAGLGPIALATERVAPSERRSMDQASDVATHWMIEALAALPIEERSCRLLRTYASARASLLSRSGDRESTLQAIDIARRCGMSPAAVANARERASDRQPIGWQSE